MADVIGGDGSEVDRMSKKMMNYEAIEEGTGNGGLIGEIVHGGFF